MPDAKPTTKPYVKLAYSFILFGMGLFALERYGLTELSGPSHTGLALDGTLTSILVLAPVGLILAGCVTFVVGRMLRR